MNTDRRSGAERRARSGFRITPRELEVLGLVLRGAGNKQIAADLGVTEQAIKEHVSTLLAKFRVPNRAALAEAGARLEFTGETGVDRSWMRDLFLGAQAQIVIARGAEIRYEAANAAFMQAVGWRPVIGRTMREAFPELAGTGVFEKIEAVYRTGVPLIEHEQERRWDTGNGIEARLVDLVVQPLHDSEGAVNGIVSYVVDVTDVIEERRHAELLRDEFAAVMDEVPSGVVVFDAKGHVLKVNDAARRIARVSTDGTRRDGASMDPFRVRYPDGSPIPFEDQPTTRALRGEDVPPQELSFTSNGVEVGIRESVRALRDHDGKVVGAIVILTELWSRPAD